MSEPLAGPEEWIEMYVEPREGRVQRLHDGFMVTCSNRVAHAHYDRTPSLHLTPGRTQPIAFRCFAGCTQDQVLEAERLTWADVLKRDAERAKSARAAPICVRALYDVVNDVHVVATSFLSLSLRTKLSSSSARRGRCAWRLEERERWPELMGKGSHELVLPPHTGRAMWLVAGDLVQLANERIARGELRPIPYARRWGAARLDLAPSSVQYALKRLAAIGVIVNEGRMINTYNPFLTVPATPDNPFREPPPTWSLRVWRREDLA